MKKTSLALPIPQNIDDHLKSATIFDRNDPDSIFNRTMGYLHECVVAVEKSKTGMRNMRLHAKAIRDLLKPEPRDAKLRQGFWEEYSRAIDRDSNMRIEYIPGGVCTLELFMEMIADPEKMGYLLNAPTSYMRNAEDLLNVTMDRLRDILELPLVNSKGQVQGAVVSAVLKAAEMLDKRVRGAVLQRVAVHQHHTQGGQVVGMDDSGVLASDQLALLESEIQKVRKKLDEKYAILPAVGGPQVVDIGDKRDEET